MFVVNFVENKNVMLTQLLKQVPSVGDEIKIKGRRGKVTDIEKVDDKQVHVQVVLNPIVKATVAADQSKKRKR